MLLLLLLLFAYTIFKHSSLSWRKKQTRQGATNVHNLFWSQSLSLLLLLLLLLWIKNVKLSNVYFLTGKVVFRERERSIYYNRFFSSQNLRVIFSVYLNKKYVKFFFFCCCCTLKLLISIFNMNINGNLTYCWHIAFSYCKVFSCL